MDAQPRAHLTPTLLLCTIVTFGVGGLSLGFNPLLASSVIALLFGIVTLRGASGLTHDITKGYVRGFAVMGIMGGLGGAMLVLMPSLGLTALQLGAR